MEQKIPNVLLQRSDDSTYSPLTYLVKSLEGELWMVRRFISRVVLYGTDSDVRIFTNACET